jgi:L-lactate utilization protein LutB
MEQPIQAYWNIKLKELKERLEKNNFEVYIAESVARMQEVVLQTILAKLSPRSISWGGSMTFTGSGLYNILKDRTDITVLNTFEKTTSPEKLLEIRRNALLTDLFITGTNAVTEDGQLVNLDMIGNRIAGLTFGPRHVIVLVGRNKVVRDLEEAMVRVKDYAAPANAMRLDKKTPCTKTATCHECSSPDRICNTWTITEKSYPKGRVHIVLVNQDLGL